VSGFESLQETEDANCRVAPFQAKDRRADEDLLELQWGLQLDQQQGIGSKIGGGVWN